MNARTIPAPRRFEPGTLAADRGTASVLNSARLNSRLVEFILELETSKPTRDLIAGNFSFCHFLNEHEKNSGVARFESGRFAPERGTTSALNRARFISRVMKFILESEPSEPAPDRVVGYFSFHHFFNKRAKNSCAAGFEPGTFKPNRGTAVALSRARLNWWLVEFILESEPARY